MRYPYSGRAVFHHQEKTAGQAVNAWLQRHLGAGTVTPNLIGDHRSLIRQYGGEYPVLSGHMSFDGSGLDPRYTYFTVLREPVDRMISWLFFVDQGTDVTDYFLKLKAGARLFLKTEGEQSNELFLDSARNLYVENFRRVVMGCAASDAYKLQVASEVAEAYALVGLYEQLPTFVDALAVLLQINRHTPLPTVNVTSRRLACDQVSGKMLGNILKLTNLDRTLYARMLQLANKKAVQKVAKQVDCIPYNHEFMAWPASTPPTRPVWASTYLDIYGPASLPTQNGVACGPAVTSDGRSGLLSFGTRLALDAGQYQAVAVGCFETAGANCLAEMRCDAGLTLLTEKAVIASDTCPANFVVGLSFALSTPKQDVEFRFAIPAQHKLRLDALYLLRLEALNCHLKCAEECLLTEDGLTAGEGLVMLKPEQFNTKAGERVGSTLQSAGMDGPLCFGPYLPLGSGRYRAALVGSVGPHGLGGAYADVGFGRGQRIVHLQPLSIPPFNEEQGFIGQPWTFTLEQDVEDLEIRLWVTQRSQINLAGVILSRLGDVEPLLVTVSVPETVVQTETEASNHAD